MCEILWQKLHYFMNQIAPFDNFNPYIIYFD